MEAESTARPRVYLAGPEVFLPDAVDLGARKKAACAAHGLEGLFPFDNEVVPAVGGPAVDVLIYRGNVAMMEACDCAILNLSPFRGPGADPGTCFELGYLTALRKPCLGYTNDPGDYRERVGLLGPVAWDPATGYWRDAEGLSVEDFGNGDSLMIDRSLSEAGHGLLRHDARGALLSDLAAFEACLRAAAAMFRR